MPLATFTLIFLTTFALSFFIIGQYRKHALRKKVVAIPNERSSHSLATPTGGGIGLILSWTFGLGLLSFSLPEDQSLLIALAAGLIVAIIGFFDDIFQLPALLRLSVHILAAGLLSYILVQHGPSTIMEGDSVAFSKILAVSALAFAVVWSINLFNFMDGMDGFAANESVFIFSIGGWFLWYQGAHWLAFAAWLLVAANLGFFAWNRPRARIFLGDVGSGFLGYLVATFAVLGQVFYSIPAVLWVILYGAFFFDASLTLIRRIIKGEKWYAAHRSHAYQRLHHLKAWSHRRILVGLAFVNMFLAGCALWSFYYPSQLYLGLGLSLTGLVIVYSGIEKVAPMKNH